MPVPDIQIWPGSSSFSPGDTPFGLYDSNAQFQTDIVSFAQWSANRLGYPIMDVELQDIHFFAAYEEAVAKYGALVNMVNARQNLPGVQGLPTSSVNLSQQYVKPTLHGILQIAKEYGSAAGSGGTQKWFTGSIQVTTGQQVYDFLDTGSVSVENGDLNNDVFTIKKIIHQERPFYSSYLDPTIGTVGAFDQLMRSFGWGNMGTPVDFTMMPLHYDLMRLQAIEFHGKIRRSSYSFKLTGTRLRLFPIPKTDFEAIFFYTLDDDILDSSASGSGNEDLISDISNIPYSDIDYGSLNSMSRQWIRDYAHAIAMETLGMIRNKYADSYPMVDDKEIQLNGGELLSKSSEMKVDLEEKLREELEKGSRTEQLKRSNEESEALMNQLSRIPGKFYIR